MTDLDYADDQVLFANKLAWVEFLIHSLEHMLADKTESMCFIHFQCLK